LRARFIIAAISHLDVRRAEVNACRMKDFVGIDERQPSFGLPKQKKPGMAGLFSMRR
jgi:hypothetical protein